MEPSRVRLCILTTLCAVLAYVNADTGSPPQIQEPVQPHQSGDEDKAVDYSGAQVWKVETHQAFPIIRNLTNEEVITVWGGNRTSIDVMVKAGMLDNIANIFRSNNIPFEIMIRDLQQNIDEENPPLSESQILLQNRQGHRLTWLKYHRVEDIYGFLHYLATTYPKYCSVKNVGKSYKGIDLKVLRISNGNPGNKAIWVDGGIHAREWISPATVTYIINQFAENFDEESPEVQNIDWYFMPMVNPDGYEYSHTINRMWRKNRSGSGLCAGVDLNRNFGYKWGGKGTSSYPCSETYKGVKAFSEPESKSISDFIESSGANFRGYLTYHSYGQYLLYPWGYDELYPQDHDELQRVGDRMAMAIAETGGSKYKVGASSITLYPAAGGSDDWAYSKGMKYAYTVELSDTGRDGFILPAKYILPVAKESLAGLRVVAKAVYDEQ